MNELGLSEYDTSMICSSVYYVRLFEKTVEITKNPKDSANWIMGELMKMLNDTQTLPENMSFRPESLGEIINLLNSNKISRDSAKRCSRQCLRKMLSLPIMLRKIIWKWFPTQALSKQL